LWDDSISVYRKVITRMADWHARSSDDERRALGWYRGAGYQSINEVLRVTGEDHDQVASEYEQAKAKFYELWDKSAGDKALRESQEFKKAYDAYRQAEVRWQKLGSLADHSDDTKQAANLAAKAVERSPEFDPIVVYRGIKGRSSGTAERLKDSVGKTIKLKGLTSTSVREGVAKGFQGLRGVLMRIRTHKGLPLNEAVAPGSEAGGEMEVLLGHNWEYRVAGYKDSGKGYDVVDMELVSTDKEKAVARAQMITLEDLESSMPTLKAARLAYTLMRSGVPAVEAIRCARETHKIDPVPVVVEPQGRRETHETHPVTLNASINIPERIMMEAARPAEPAQVHVTVEPTPVHIDVHPTPVSVPATVVNVPPADVHVHPEITVMPPAVTVVNEIRQKQKDVTFQHDASGQITGAKITPKEGS